MKSFPERKWRTMAAGLCLLALAFVKPGATAAPPTNPFVWDSQVRRIQMDGMSKLAVFTFWVTNTSPAEAAIFATETSCDCTVAQLPSQPWRFKAGESGSLAARFNVTGKFGSVTNRVGVVTSHGLQWLTVIAEIPLTPAPFNTSPREQDVEIARADRQAVFKNASCAVCHAQPAFGRTGEALYAAACGICHDSERRAGFVPDLARLTVATNAAYWRDWIADGKAGSLMPAFAKDRGGILDTNQIELLVKLLAEKYPSVSR